MSDTQSIASDNEASDRGSRSETPKHREERIRAKNEAIRERNKHILALRDKAVQKWRAKKPEVGKVDVQHFKNRYNWTPEYRECAVEALVGPWNLYQQFRDEKHRREPEDRLLKTLNRVDVLAQLGMAITPAESRKDSRTAIPDMDMGETYIHRIRINSLPVLGYMTAYMGLNSRRTESRTFMRPFMSLLSSLPTMKRILAELEKKFANVKVDTSGDVTEGTVPAADERDTAQLDAAQTTSVTINQTLLGEQDRSLPTQHGDHRTDAMQDTNGSIDAENQQGASDDTASVYATELESVASDEPDEQTTKIEQVMDTHEALRDMKCYVDFIDQEILPHFNFLRGDQSEKVIFDDLWCIFQPGDLLYLHNKGIPGDRDEESWEEEIWRLYRVATPTFESGYTHFGGQDDLQGRFRSSEKITLYCYRIGHDGSTYGAIRMKLEIPYFPGRRAIRSMSIYPLRFAKNSEGILEAARLQGQKFRQACTQRHQLYQNWTLEADIRTSPEFIEGHVIVDFEETFKKVPEWRPDFHHPTIDKDGSFDDVFDQWDILYWPNDPATSNSSCFSFYDLIQQDHNVQLHQRRELFDTDTFWRQQSKPSRFDTDKVFHQAVTVRDEDLILLPRRSFAYTLRERKFVAIDTNHLRPVPVDNGLFDSLQILSDYKDIIRGLVSSHFRKKELELLYTSRSIEGFDQDLIRGKGKGLVLLLHGAPGVGKTATAEAVAMENRKPLFTITCGDLGLTPSEVETSLNEIFRLAGKWGCVLLLDEADVYLSQRSRLDLQRNALVSVFLRVLEYYSGLLFLTTNRVGTIDEAFKSRIHMALYYPPLDKEQTKEIFKVNIRRLRQIEEQKSFLTDQPQLIIHDGDIVHFAEQHFDQNVAAGDCWNGRQIRNSFQIASSLAYYHHELKVKQAQINGQDPPAPPELDSSLFAKVQKATHDFNIYMKETRGWNDADLAHKQSERADYVRVMRFAPADTQQHSPSGMGTQVTGTSGLGPSMYVSSPSPAPGMVLSGQQMSMQNATVHNMWPGQQSLHATGTQNVQANHLGGAQSLNVGVSASTNAGQQIYQPVPQAGPAYRQQHNGLSPGYHIPTTPQQSSIVLGSPPGTVIRSSPSPVGGQPVGHEQTSHLYQASGSYAGLRSGAGHTME